jgi:hypothetical protein
METKENAQVETKAKSNETRIVVIVAKPDGTASMWCYEVDKELPGPFKVFEKPPSSIKDFDKIPKRIQFFFEKGFSGANLDAKS